MDQQIRFCTTPDGVRIAYATVGEGPPLVRAAHWLTHLEDDWRVWGHWHEGLAQHHQLVRYDERGSGLSDWKVDDFSVEVWVRDLETVVDTLELDRFPLLGISQGGPVAIAYAVLHPEKVSHLILYGSFAIGLAKDDLASPSRVEGLEAMVTLTKLNWGRDNPFFRQIFTMQMIPEATIEEIRDFNELQRISTSPENAVRFLGAFYNVDVRELASQISVPTLVFHRRKDAFVSFENGRRLASLIPNARFVPLEGAGHAIMEDEPEWFEFLRELRSFLGIAEEAREDDDLTIREPLFPSQTIPTTEDDPYAQKALSIISDLDVVTLSNYRVVGNYTRYQNSVLNTLKDARQKIVSGILNPGKKRENHLIWAGPGSGKTYFVQQIASILTDAVTYYELNLAKFNEEEFHAELTQLDSTDKPCLCLVDEIDAKPNEPWPYEILLPYLDVASEGKSQFVFVLAGSSGSSLVEMKEMLSSRPKGNDLLSRIPMENEIVIPPISIGDRILVALSQFKQVGHASGREIQDVEKLGLYYIAQLRQLANVRQLHEFVIRAVEQIPIAEDRIKYDHLFRAGDPENKRFWARVSSFADKLVGEYVGIVD